MRLSKKFAAIAITTVSVVGLATGAFAYFTASGSGGGSASVGSPSTWHVSDGVVTAGGPLFPGSGIETISYTVTNPSSGHQNLSSAAVSVVGTPACPAAWFTVDNTGSSTALGNYAGGTSQNGTATIILNDSGTPQNGCQGSSPALSIAVS